MYVYDFEGEEGWIKTAEFVTSNQADRNSCSCKTSESSDILVLKYRLSKYDLLLALMTTSGENRALNMMSKLVCSKLYGL